MDRAVAVVYDPPKGGLPYLAAVFLPGKEEPTIMPFKTAAEAEKFIENVAKGLAGLHASSLQCTNRLAPVVGLALFDARACFSDAGFAHAAADSLADLGLTSRLHTLLERVHDVHDLWSLSTLRRACLSPRRPPAEEPLWPFAPATKLNVS